MPLEFIPKELDMERPIFQPVGTPAEELDTPALVVDLSSLEKNIETVHSFFQGVDAKLRPHVARHGCARIAHLQMAAGGTGGGIAVTTVGEAEVFAGVGLIDITIANQVVGPSKIRRLCALAAGAKVTVAVDNPSNVSELSRAAASVGVNLGLLVEVDVGLGRCGVPPGAEVVSLARQIAGAGCVNFQGLLAVLPKPGLESMSGGLESETRRAVQPVLDTRELLEKEGLPVATVSV